MVAFNEREVPEIQVRSLEFPEDLRPDTSKLPQGEELADMLEDINRGRHGLPPLHGGFPIYYIHLGIYSRETLLERDGKIFIPENKVSPTH